MQLSHLFVPYNIALLAKQKGFKEYCLSWYPNDFELCDGLNINIEGNYVENHKYPQKGISAPLHRQLIDWFRIQHNLIVSADSAFFSVDHPEDKQLFYPKIYKWLAIKDFKDISLNNKEHIVLDGNSGLETLDYYKALNTSIEEAFKLIK